MLHTARARQAALYGELLRAKDDEPYTTTLRRAWAVIAGPEGQPYLQLFALWRPATTETSFPDASRATLDWLGPLAKGLDSLGRPELATLALAVLRSLLMDLDATGDGARTAAVFEDFLQTLQASASPQG